MPKAPTPSLSKAPDALVPNPTAPRRRVSEVYKRIAVKFVTQGNPRLPFFYLGVPENGAIDTTGLEWNGKPEAKAKTLRLLKHCRTLDIVLGTWQVPPWFKLLPEFAELENAFALVTAVNINNGAEIPFQLPKLQRLVRSYTIPETFKGQPRADKAFYDLQPAPLPPTVKAVAFMLAFSKGSLKNQPALSALGLRGSTGVKNVYFQFEGDVPPPTPACFVKSNRIFRMLFFLVGSITPLVPKAAFSFLWRERTNEPEDYFCGPACIAVNPCDTCGLPPSPEDFSPDSTFVRTGLITITSMVEFFRENPDAFDGYDSGAFFGGEEGERHLDPTAPWCTRVRETWDTILLTARDQKLEIKSFSAFKDSNEGRQLPWPA
ncbi:hypothetical protein Q8F55_009252 [Vanrija albida]|uniref:Uncharacterized protein n=1 Tax=Vanrija albida TaxID=181172 RepID=A0ABR3PT49_9TREE